MKKIFGYILLLALVASCSSSSKLLNSGNYEGAINKAVKKLKSNKQNDKEIIVLEEAYQKANARNQERVTFLKKEGKPDNWDEIFSLYSKMKHQQEQVKPLLPLHIASQHRNANFVVVDYDDEIIQAKKNATEYFYAHALSLLEKNNKTDARKAHCELEKVKSFSSNYKDVDRELILAKNMGTSFVLFKMKNTTGVPLPPTFEEELTKISLTDLNSEWLQYHTNTVSGLNYDYTILVNMKNINVSPEGLKETNFSETKIIPDGFQYILDAHGNVKKDSLGNDIKQPKTKTIVCSVTETDQSKKAIIAGTLDYINNSTGQLMKTDPIASENFFEHRSLEAFGDINALTPATKAKLGNRPVPFPSGFDMLLQAGQTLKAMVRKIIYTNKNILY